MWFDLVGGVIFVFLGVSLFAASPNWTGPQGGWPIGPTPGGRKWYQPAVGIAMFGFGVVRLVLFVIGMFDSG